MAIVFAPYSLWVQNQRIWRKLSSIVLLLKFSFVRTPLIIRLLIRICLFAVWSLLKLFWFFETLGDTTEKQGIINLTCYGSETDVSLNPSDSEVTCFWGRLGCSLPNISILYLVYTLHNGRSISSNFLVFHVSGCNSLRPAAVPGLIFN